MTITIRPLQTIDEYRAAEQVQGAAWRKGAVSIVPDHLLLTIQKNGGLVLGAFDEALADAPLVGYAFGFLGFTQDGHLKHCSHMAGVVPAYQNRGVGYQLKLAQRDAVLAQGLDLITWTFDPLETRNASLNFRKLGVVCHAYLRNLYGSMRDGLNAGLPSDRVEVEWHIASDHVARRLGLDSARLDLPQLLAAGTPILNGPTGAEEAQAWQLESLPAAGRLLIQVSSHFQAIKANDIPQAMRWRMQTRACFEAAFAAGYSAIDLLYGERYCYYLLDSHDPTRG